MNTTRQALAAAALGAVSAFTLLQISSAGAQEATTDSTEVPAAEAPATDDSTTDVPEKDCPEDGLGGGRGRGPGGGGGADSSTDNSSNGVDDTQV